MVTVQIGRFAPHMTALPTQIVDHPLMSRNAMASRAVAAKGIASLELTASQREKLTAGDMECLSRPQYFPGLNNVRYEGPRSTSPLAYHYYNPALKIPSLQMTMGELLPFAMPAWHFNTSGADIFSGMATIHHPWDGMVDPVAQAVVRVRALFEFNAKLGIQYHCWHDGDYVDLSQPRAAAKEQFGLIGETMAALQAKTGIMTGWGTNQFFVIPLYRDGAATAAYAPAFAHACDQAMQSIDTTISLGGKRFVFWGGREGIYDLLSTRTKLEKENLARFLKMCVKYAEAKGFFANGGKFLIEPKGKEPTMHQYDRDVETCMAFLKENGLEKYFEFNVEVNHAYLAGSTAEHEFQMAIDRNMLGGIDANDGVDFVGWDVDRYATLRAGLAIGKAIYANRGLWGGVINHDAKLQGYFLPDYASDMAAGVIGAQDACAIGLWLAHFMRTDGRMDMITGSRYHTWSSGEVADAVRKEGATLESVAALVPQLEKSGAFNNVPGFSYEVFHRIAGELQIGLMPMIEQELKTQGLE